jgi:hypothetical protein
MVWFEERKTPGVVTPTHVFFIRELNPKCVIQSGVYLALRICLVVVSPPGDYM